MGGGQDDHIEAHLTDMSVSGAFLHTEPDSCTSADTELRWTDNGDATHPSTISAHVVRRCATGVGIEWADFAPPAVCVRLNRHWLRETMEQLRAPNQD